MSYQHNDRQQAAGFNLLQWNPNVDFEFVERHLLTPAESADPNYIRSRIREELSGTSVTVVLIGQRTAESEWVDFEIRESLARGNGVLGVRLKGIPNAPAPAALEEAGARIINWSPDEFSDEIERAALIAGRPELGPPEAHSGGSLGQNCAR